MIEQIEHNNSPKCHTIIMSIHDDVTSSKSCYVTDTSMTACQPNIANLEQNLSPIERKNSSDTNDTNKAVLKCTVCEYTCSKRGDYNKHIKTVKHLRKSGRQSDDFSTCKREYTCSVCNKVYTSRNSLWYHSQKCIPTPSPPPENRIVHEPISESMVIKCFQTMMEAQAVRDEVAMAAHADAAAEQTRLLIEAISLKGPQCIMNNTTNNNNQFNLNVFLNEDCKDAFTLKEVIESIVCTVSDLDRMDTDGYAATITRKILESMQHMSITERPIHCTDARRNAVCVKNETGWERNEKAMTLLVNSVYFVGRKLGRMIEDWKLAYPDHYHGTVSRRDQFHRLVTDAMSVADLEVEARIASKVCKGVILDRKAAMGHV
jgi:hypothetical protein